jgi:hypothetical protein
VLILVVLSILDRIEALTHRRLRIPPRETLDREGGEDEGKSEDHLP